MAKRLRELVFALELTAAAATVLGNRLSHFTRPFRCSYVFLQLSVRRKGSEDASEEASEEASEDASEEAFEEASEAASEDASEALDELAVPRAATRLTQRRLNTIMGVDEDGPKRARKLDQQGARRQERWR